MPEELDNQNVTNTIERATICEQQKEKLSILAAQANDALSGVASVTKSDIVNLLLEEHPTELSEAQIEKLRSRHVDEVKYAFWIAKRLKQARANGETLTLNDLLAQNSIPLPAHEVPQKRARRRRKKEAGEMQVAIAPEEANS